MKKVMSVMIAFSVTFLTKAVAQDASIYPKFLNKTS
jgi:hypothetical protein